MACADNRALNDLRASTCRWQSLRATEGWAALQHHNLLRTTLTVYPPSSLAHGQVSSVPRLAVTLIQGSFFTIRSPLNSTGTQGSAFVPEWHTGNIYAMARAPPNFVDLPSPPSLDAPTTYELVVSGDYEVRTLPHDIGNDQPLMD